MVWVDAGIVVDETEVILRDSDLWDGVVIERIRGSGIKDSKQYFVINLVSITNYNLVVLEICVTWSDINKWALVALRHNDQRIGAPADSIPPVVLLLSCKGNRGSLDAEIGWIFPIVGVELLFSFDISTVLLDQGRCAVARQHKSDISGRFAVAAKIGATPVVRNRVLEPAWTWRVAGYDHVGDESEFPLISDLIRVVEIVSLFKLPDWVPADCH